MNSNFSPFQSPCLNRDSGDCQNYSANTLSGKLRFSSTITTLIYLVYLFPFCFGVFGNISVCLIFFQQKKLRSITNIFLMNLCLNDLIVLCFSIPMTLSTALLDNWVLNIFICKFIHFTPTVTALVSTFTVAAISVERWHFIVNGKKIQRSHTILILILLWSLSILIALPEFISRDIQDLSPHAIMQGMLNSSSLMQAKQNSKMNTSNNYTTRMLPEWRKRSYCLAKPDLHMKIFSYIIIIVQYLVPFLFVSVSCYSISCFLKRRMHRMNTHEINNRSKQDLENRFSRSNTSTIFGRQSQNDQKKRSKVFYRIHSTLRSSRRSSEYANDQQNQIKAQSHSKRRFHRSRKLLIYVAILFTISWLPLTTVQLCLEHNQPLYSKLGENIVYGFLLIPCYLISSLSAWMNPIIYNYVNHHFRREFYLLYPCCQQFSSSRNRKDTAPIKPKRTRSNDEYLLTKYQITIQNEN